MHNLLSANKGIFEFIRKNDVIDHYPFLVKDMVNRGLQRVATCTYIVFKISGWGKLWISEVSLTQESAFPFILRNIYVKKEYCLFTTYLTCVNLCKLVPFYLKSYNTTLRTISMLFVKSFKCVDMNFKFKKSISANSIQLRSWLELLGIPPSLKKKPSAGYLKT